MRVFIGCEESGKMRRAFSARGHFAVSCDMLPSRDSRDASTTWIDGVAMGAGKDGNRHLVGDVFHWLAFFRKAHVHFDLLIHHAPCTFSTLAGVRWLYGGKGTVRDPVRWAAMESGARFFRRLQDYPHIPRRVGENPIPHRYAKALMGDYTQIIQPWQYGHGETKATCLWLHNLPELRPTAVVEGREHRIHSMGPSPDRAKLRSETYQGIADAFADQYGSLVV